MTHLTVSHLGITAATFTLWSARKAFFLALALSICSFASGQPRTGTVTATLLNGTEGGPGKAEEVNLLKLETGMEPIKHLGKVSGQFTVENIPLTEAGSYLLQVTSGGVHYNERLDFGSDNHAEVSVTVFDVTKDPSVITVKSGRFLLGPIHNRLRVEKLYVVENKSRPRQTFYDPEGTFRYYVPNDATASVHVSSPSGMPIPQSASPLPDGSGFVTSTAFRPGTTDVTIAYDVDYSSGRYDIEERAFYALPQMLVLITPADVELEADAWENLTPNPQSRFVVLRQSGVEAGSSLDLSVVGGSVHAVQAMIPDRGQPNPHPHGELTQVSDPFQYQVWFIVIGMGAVLTVGLLMSIIALAPNQQKRPVESPTATSESNVDPV